MVPEPSGRDSAPTGLSGGSLALSALFGVGALVATAERALAHAGHPAGHEAGGSPLLPTVILLGSVVVIGAGAYLDYTNGVDGRLARLAVLLGIGGVLVGILAAV